MTVSTSVLDRHAQIAVLIDRLHSSFDLCHFDQDNGDYQKVDDWHKDLIEQLEWLQSLLATAIANDGDVRSCVGGAKPPPAPPPPSNVRQLPPSGGH